MGSFAMCMNTYLLLVSDLTDWPLRSALSPVSTTVHTEKMHI